MQDKVWVRGPGVEPWEVYTVTADAPDALGLHPVDAQASRCCTPEGAARRADGCGRRVSGMTDPELSALRHRADHGDRDALDELIELASERGDADELRRLADAGSTTATDELIQLSSDRGDLPELRRLADGGNATATDELIELATERGDLAELGRLADAGNATAADQLLELRSE